MTPVAISGAAARRKLKSAVILEHVPQIFQGEEPPVWFSRKNDRSHLDLLYSELDDTAQGGAVLLIKGAEIDIEPVALDGTAMLDDTGGVEYVAMATHLIPGGRSFWFNVGPMPEPVALRMLETYVDWVSAALVTGRFRTWVHPGALIAKAGLVPDFSRRSVVLLEKILSVMSERDVAFELNELLARKITGAYLETYAELVGVARSWGIRFVVGSDAHSPDAVGVFKWVAAVARRAHLTREDFVGPDELL
ncbi:MAG: hypothetical protein JW909_04365 [Planctomycetes bacterium]|nr:hypothetical protein [Planctomycetota bacterium]